MGTTTTVGFVEEDEETRAKVYVEWTWWVPAERPAIAAERRFIS